MPFGGTALTFSSALRFRGAYGSMFAPEAKVSLKFAGGPCGGTVPGGGGKLAGLYSAWFGAGAY
jgi:hypothetical protein